MEFIIRIPLQAAGLATQVYRIHSCISHKAWYSIAIVEWLFFHHDKTPIHQTTLARIIARVARSKQGTKFTYLSATTCGVSDVKEVVKVAKNERIMLRRKTILFIDEIHRFNKLQQVKNNFIFFFFFWGGGGGVLLLVCFAFVVDDVVAYNWVMYMVVWNFSTFAGLSMRVFAFSVRQHPWRSDAQPLMAVLYPVIQSCCYGYLPCWLNLVFFPKDAFLPHVEDGTITLLGATTENPSFQLNSALLSRCRVIVLEKLQPPEIESLLRRALPRIGAREETAGERSRHVEEETGDPSRLVCESFTLCTNIVLHSYSLICRSSPPFCCRWCVCVCVSFLWFALTEAEELLFCCKIKE